MQTEAIRFNKCPNQPCSNGYHPIHIAARNASVGVLEVLLRYADKKGCVRRDMITIPDLEGNVPLHLAVHSGEIKVRAEWVKVRGNWREVEGDIKIIEELSCLKR